MIYLFFILIVGFVIIEIQNRRNSKKLQPPCYKNKFQKKKEKSELCHLIAGSPITIDHSKNFPIANYTTEDLHNVAKYFGDYLEQEVQELNNANL